MGGHTPTLQLFPRDCNLEYGRPRKRGLISDRLRYKKNGTYGLGWHPGKEDERLISYFCCRNAVGCHKNYSDGTFICGKPGVAGSCRPYLEVGANLLCPVARYHQGNGPFLSVTQSQITKNYERIMYLWAKSAEVIFLASNRFMTFPF